MSDKPLLVCKDCDKPTLKKMIPIPYVIVDSKKPKTIGELADKNTERMVSEGKLNKSTLNYRENIEKRHSFYKKMWDINKLSPKQKKEYILKGTI